MTKREKLFDRIKNNPKEVMFSEIKTLLEQEEFSLERTSGSHHIFRRNEITFVIPVHNKKVKTVYVKRVIELIEESRDGES